MRDSGARPERSRRVGVSARRLAVALSVASPRADYRAVGFPLRSLTLNKRQAKAGVVAFTLVTLLATSCSNQDFRRQPIEQYVLGTWLRDSTNRQLERNEHPRIQLIDFESSNSAINHFFSIRHNKDYITKFEFELTDTSFNYNHHLSVPDPSSAGYRLERLDQEHFRLIANFSVSGWSEPERDSIIWYSKVPSAQEYLEPFIASGNTSVMDCPSPSMSRLHGYWKMDSTEYMNLTVTEKHYYFYFDTTGMMHTLWLGSKPYHKSEPIKIGRESIIGDEGDSILIKCLVLEHMTFETSEESSAYEAVYFTRIEPDAIIPDSLRVDHQSPRVKARQ